MWTHDAEILNLRMIKLIGMKLRKVESKVEDLIFKDVRERIMACLLRFAEAFGKIKERQISVLLWAIWARLLNRPLSAL